MLEFCSEIFYSLSTATVWLLKLSTAQKTMVATEEPAFGSLLLQSPISSLAACCRPCLSGQLGGAAL